MEKVYMVSIRRSKRAKRMSLRIHGHGEVELVLPRTVSQRVGNAFIASKRAWIARALASQEARNTVQKPVVFADGASIPCFGDTVQLSVVCDASRRRSSVNMVGNMLVVHSSTPEKAKRAVEAWYKKEALAYCTGQSQEYAGALRVSVNTVRVIDMKTQWGSCNRRTRALTFNWKLAFAPEEIARYVVAHEVAHILEGSHAASFWRVVQKLDSDYVLHRRWLRTYGGGLYMV